MTKTAPNNVLQNQSNPATFDREVGFEILKNVIVEQNKALIKQIAKDYLRTESRLLHRYLKPEYYLPILEN